MSNTVTFRQLGNLFGIGRSAAWYVVKRVNKWVISIAHEFIKWPEGHEVSVVELGFHNRKRIPGIIEAIDCAHFKINKPKENPLRYYNRKRYYSINIQGVTDADKKFTHIYCGEPGSLHDARVFRRSSLFMEVMGGAHIEMFPDNTFLIGDSAYPSNFWLVPPFKDDGDLTYQQSRFNFLHSSQHLYFAK